MEIKFSLLRISHVANLNTGFRQNYANQMHPAIVMLICYDVDGYFHPHVDDLVFFKNRFFFAK